MTTDPILSSGTGIATSPEDDMTLPSLEPLVRTLRKILGVDKELRALEEQRRALTAQRDAEIVAAVDEDGTRGAQSELARALYSQLGRDAIKEPTIRKAVREQRKKGND
jgi:hypothetical protein